VGRGAWSERIVASESEGSELAVIKSAKTKPNCSGVRYWHIGTYDERRRDRPRKQSQFPARGAGLWRPSPTQRVVPRKQLKVYFFLPYARPVPVKVGLELNRSAVGKTASSLVYPRPQQLTPLPCGGSARPLPWNQGDPPCSFPPWPRMAAGSNRFWLLELRVSRTFLDQLRSQLFTPWIPNSMRCQHLLSSLGPFLAA
jgi:hypothetical protein